MALQGTLETFALADVLRLLASTKKTGVLRIDGDRGNGSLSVVDGELVGASATGAPRAERPGEVLFELLRYGDGSFVFDSDIEVTSQGEHQENVEEALADAEEQLREWREIEAVVPSPTRLVTLDPERGEEQITLTAPQWKAVVALGDGCTTEVLSERLGISELPASRVVRDLVELGAARIGEEELRTTTQPEPPADAGSEPDTTSESAAVIDLAPVAPTESVAPDDSEAPAAAAADTGISFADTESLIAPTPESSPPPPPPPPPPSGTDGPLLSTDASGSGPSAAFAPPPTDAAESNQAAFAPPPPPAAPTAEDPIAGWNDDPDDDGLSSFHSDEESVPLFGASEEAPGPDDPFGPDPFQIPTFGSPEDAREAEEASEMARQLANLSPRAQQAVAAAASADTDEEREQAIARAQDASGEPINRNLLLKYLSSVDE